MLIPRTIRLLLPAAVLALATPSYCQPAESLPPTQGNAADVDKANTDGSTGSRKLTAADYQAYINLWASGSAYEDWQENVLRRRPGNASNLQATVSGTTVALTWTPGGPAMVAGTTTQYLTRDGTVIAQLAPTVSSHTDQSVSNGSHTWIITSRNVTTAPYAGTYAPLGTPPSVTATVGSNPPPPSGSGWTDISLPSGALRFHVASSGSDTNAGTEAAPLKTIQAGYAKLRDGQPDQLLLKCGDSWTLTSTISLTKASGFAASKYMVIGSYGTGARPKIIGNLPQGNGDTNIFSASGKRGIAFVGIDFSGNGTIQQNAFQMFGCSDILWEDCCFHDIHRGIAFQQSGARPIVHRNVVYNIRSNGCNGTNCPQFCYFDLATDWKFTENFFDQCGIAGSMYSRTCYFQDNCGPGVFRGNVVARGQGDGGVQVRAGGTVVDNLFLRIPIASYTGNNGVTNEIAYNVVLESGDIGPGNLARGRGLHFNGQTNCHDNVLGYNTGTGWGSVHGIYANGASGSILRNFIFNWTRRPGDGGQGDTNEAQGILIDSGTFTVSNNRVFNLNPGIVMEPRGSVSGSGNQYWTPAGSLGGDFRPNSTFAGWTKLGSQQPDPNLRALLPGGSIDTYAALIRGQSKQTWRDDLMAANVNRTIRAAVGVAEPVQP